MVITVLATASGLTHFPVVEWYAAASIISAMSKSESSPNTGDDPPQADRHGRSMIHSALMPSTTVLTNVVTTNWAWPEVPSLSRKQALRPVLSTAWLSL